MGTFSGGYSSPGGTAFDEARQMVTLLQQQKSPIVDVLLNTASHAMYTALRRLIQSTFKNGSPFGAFSIETNTKEFDFVLTAGTGSYTASGLSDAVATKTNTEVPTGPARFFVGGHVALLPADRRYQAASVLGSPEIHSQITALSNSTLTDSSAFFGILGGTLVGKWVSINIDDTSSVNNTPKQFQILSYTTTTLTLDLTQHRHYNPSSGAMTVVASGITKLSDLTSVGKLYRIEPSVPGAARADSIYLDVYLDEMDENDDPIVRRPIRGTPVTSANFGYVKQRIEWIQGYNGGTSAVSGVSDGTETEQNNLYEIRTDSDGNVHHRVLLAVFKKDTSGGTIDSGDITLYHNDPLWGLTLGSLPTKTTGSVVDGTAGTDSIGSNDVPGTFNGSSLDMPNLLLQSLGNVSDDMNKAFQNMGDYAASGDSAVKGVPGIGEALSATPALADDRHILLGTNEEQAAIIHHTSADDVPTYNNVFITVRGHRGKQTSSTVVAGQVAEHGNLTSGSNSETADTTNDTKSILKDTSNTWFTSNPPAPVIASTRYMSIAPGNDENTSYYIDTRISTSGFANIAAFTAAYALFPMVSLACSKSSSSGGGGHIAPEVGHANLWAISSDNHLLLRIRAGKEDSGQSAMHISVMVMGMAKSP